MAEKDLETEKLELSLFRRKRKKDAKDENDQDEQASTAEVDAPPQEDTEPSGATDPVAAGAHEPDAQVGEAPTTEAPAARPAPDLSEPAGPSEPAEPAEPSGATAAAPPARDEDTQVISTPAPTGVQTGRGRRRGRSARGARVAPRQPRSRPRPQVQVPDLSAQLAVLVVGAVIGLVAVVLTVASLRLCELVTGTESCGGPGLVVLLAVAALMIFGGSAALSLFGVPDSGGLSFLGVAIFVAVCLVVLLPNLLAPWMIVVAPLLCALSFAAAHWVVTRFDEDILEPDGPAPHDVR